MCETLISEEVLVARAKMGDKEAFETLVHRYEKKLVGLVRRIVKKVDDAEDVVQDVFVKVYLKLDTFRGDSTFQSWLMRIAYNEAISFIRQQRPDQLPDDFELELGGLSDERVLRLMQLRLCIEGLPDEKRQPLLLWMGWMTQQEIADSLGIPVTKVVSRIFDDENGAIALVKRCMNEKGWL